MCMWSHSHSARYFRCVCARLRAQCRFANGGALFRECQRTRDADAPHKPVTRACARRDREKQFARATCACARAHISCAMCGALLIAIRSGIQMKSCIFLAPLSRCRAGFSDASRARSQHPDVRTAVHIALQFVRMCMARFVVLTNTQAHARSVRAIVCNIIV